MCDIGTYQPHTAQPTCLACPDGTTTDHKGAEAVGDCHKSQKQDGLSTGTLSVIGMLETDSFDSVNLFLEPFFSLDMTLTRSFSLLF